MSDVEHLEDVERLQAENDELVRKYAWRSASCDKLLALVRDLLSDDPAKRELAAGRALAMLEAIEPEGGE